MAASLPRALSHVTPPELIALYDAGGSIRGAALALDVSRRAVHDGLIGLGIARRRPGRHGATRCAECSRPAWKRRHRNGAT